MTVDVLFQLVAFALALHVLMCVHNLTSAHGGISASVQASGREVSKDKQWIDKDLK